MLRTVQRKRRELCNGHLLSALPCMGKTPKTARGELRSGSLGARVVFTWAPCPSTRALARSPSTPSRFTTSGWLGDAAGGISGHPECSQTVALPLARALKQAGTGLSEARGSRRPPRCPECVPAHRWSRARGRLASGEPGRRTPASPRGDQRRRAQLLMGSNLPGTARSQRPSPRYPGEVAPDLPLQPHRRVSRWSSSAPRPPPA